MTFFGCRVECFYKVANDLRCVPTDSFADENEEVIDDKLTQVDNFCVVLVC